MLVKILDSTGNPILDITGDFIWVWDDSDGITTPASEVDDGGICIPTSSPIDRQ